jgi:hypothetical protein
MNTWLNDLKVGDEVVRFNGFDHEYAFRTVAAVNTQVVTLGTGDMYFTSNGQPIKPMPWPIYIIEKNEENIALVLRNEMENMDWDRVTPAQLRAIAAILEEGEGSG